MMILRVYIKSIYKYLYEYSIITCILLVFESLCTVFTLILYLLNYIYIIVVTLIIDFTHILNYANYWHVKYVCKTLIAKYSPKPRCNIKDGIVMD